MKVRKFQYTNKTPTPEDNPEMKKWFADFYKIILWLILAIILIAITI